MAASESYYKLARKASNYLLVRALCITDAIVNLCPRRKCHEDNHSSKKKRRFIFPLPLEL